MLPSFFDVHAHHPSLQGEKVFQQDVHSLGIHPWNVTIENIDRLIVEFDSKLMDNMFISIGECGLDKCCDAPLESQISIFKHQVEVSERLGLPLILHCVKAIDEVLQIKADMKTVQPWIFHGFRGKPQQLSQLLEKGFYFSFGMHYNVESLRQCPLDRMFFETDTCTDSVKKIYEKAANELDIPLLHLQNVIENNIKGVFYRK